MSNLNLSVDLLALKGAFVQGIKGNDGAVHTCITIPCDIAHIQCWQDKNDESRKKAFLNLFAWESKNKQYDNTHYIKQSFSKEVMDAMNEEERKNLPIIGNGKEIVSKPKEGFNLADSRVQQFAQGIGASVESVQPSSNVLPF